MDKSQFLEITSQFDDIREQLDHFNQIKSEYAKRRRRLKTLIGKYFFLKDIVDVESKSERLRGGLKEYFMAIGFDRVELVPEKLGIEDMRLWIQDKYILVEITGRNKATCDDKSAHDISKHIPLNKNKYPQYKVSGLFIVNHDSKKNFSHRFKNPFNNTNVIEIAKSHHYTLTTTIDLLYAFVEIKLGRLTIEKFVDQLCSFGEFNLRKKSGVS